MRATDAAGAAARAAPIAVRLPGHRPRRGAGTPPPATAAVTAPAGGASLRPSGLPYLAGLDGLRALAVVAVVLYHAGVDFMPAGFLGVEIFFVISGYLITSLLLSEHAATSAVSLRRFWMRRARRLLPALFLLVAAVLTYFAIFLPGEVAMVRGDALAAVGYVSNWAFILRDTPYFEQVGRPSPLLHLWSLAIEEQFYVVWPPLFVGLMALRGRALLFAAIVAGIVGSTVLMAVLYEPFADVSRVYYGTDTRAAGLLFGAALAVVWRAGALPAPRGRVVAWLFYASGLARLLRVSLDIAGLAALAGLAYIVVTFNSFQPALYLGGFALVSALTVIVIAAAVAPGGRLGRVLGVAPLRAVGLRSYSIYLWHWPIFIVTRPGIDVSLGEIELLAVRLALTLLLAEISYRFVEMPIRHGALGRIWARTRTRDGWLRQWRRGVIIGPALGGAVALGVVVAVAPAAEPPSYLTTERISTIGVVAAVEAEPEDAAPPETEPADAGAGEAEPTEAVALEPEAPEAAPPDQDSRAVALPDEAPRDAVGTAQAAPAARLPTPATLEATPASSTREQTGVTAVQTIAPVEEPAVVEDDTRSDPPGARLNADLGILPPAAAEVVSAAAAEDGLPFAVAIVQANMAAAAIVQEDDPRPSAVAAVEEAAVEEPAVEEPVVEKPVVERPVVEEPADEEAAVEEAATEEPKAEAPSAAAPVAYEAVVAAVATPARERPDAPPPVVETAAEPVEPAEPVAPVEPAAPAAPAEATVAVVAEPPEPAPPPAPRLTAIGDSVMLGAAPALEAVIGPIGIDAATSRHVKPVIGLLSRYANQGLLGETVILHIGNNGAISKDHFSDIMEVLADRTVLFVNLRVPRDWQDWNNSVLREGVAKHANAYLVDWHSASAGKRGIFYPDGYHLNPEGATFYAETVAAHLPH